MTDVEGRKTDVLVPLAAWEALLAYWKRLVELLEDQEDRAILQEWLEKRATGEAKTISLDVLEQELVGEAPAFAEDQAWFWTEEWQAGEREAEADLAAGRYETFDTMEEMIDDMCIFRNIGPHAIAECEP